MSFVYAGSQRFNLHSIIVQSHCNVNFNNWPWGEQNCTLIFGSYTYDMAHVNLEGFSLGNSGDTTIALDNFSKSRVCM